MNVQSRGIKCRQKVLVVFVEEVAALVTATSVVAVAAPQAWSLAEAALWAVDRPVIAEQLVEAQLVWLLPVFPLEALLLMV